MAEPVIIDGYCCAGGAGMGYRRAGFRVIGVDIAPQPHYPFAFVLGDAVDTIKRLLRTVRVAALHGSPPCQFHSATQQIMGYDYEDFIPQTREVFEASGLPYVIENVVGAPPGRPGDTVRCDVP